MRSSFLFFVAFLGLTICLPIGGYAAEGDLEGDLESNIPASWDKDWADFNKVMLEKQKKAKADLAKKKEEYKKVENEPDSPKKKDKLKKLAKAYWGIKIGYYQEKLKRLAALKAKYGSYPELARKIDDEINVASAELDEAEAKLKRDLAKIDCPLTIIGVASDCPD